MKKKKPIIMEREHDYPGGTVGKIEGMGDSLFMVVDTLSYPCYQCFFVDKKSLCNELTPCCLCETRLCGKSCYFKYMGMAE